MHGFWLQIIIQICILVIGEGIKTLQKNKVGYFLKILLLI